MSEKEIDFIDLELTEEQKRVIYLRLTQEDLLRMLLVPSKKIDKEA